MSKIDQRVVEMRFDNKHFESNVKTTMSTLDRLKKSLNLTGATKGLEEVGSAAKKVDVSGIGTAVDKVKLKFSALQIMGITALQEITKSAINAGKKIAGAVWNPIVEGGRKRALNTEQAMFQFRGLGMDVESAMNSANAAVKGTAYGLDEAAMAAAQLGASGVEAGDKMTEALTGISGVAAMTNSDYTSMAHIFTTVAGNGRLMGDQLRQLSSRGLNVAATLAEEFDTTEASIREMVSKGEISFDMFSTAMNNAFGEHAAKANETFSGSLMNVRAALARVGQTAATPIHESIRKTFVALIPVINEVHEALKPLIISFTEVVEIMGTKAVNFLEGLDFSNLSKNIPSITKIFSNLAKTVTSITKPISTAFRDIFPKRTAEQFTSLVETLKKFSEGLALSKRSSENLRRTFAGLFAVMDIVSNIFTTILKFIFPKFNTGARGIGASILEVTANIGDWLVNLNETIKSSDIFNKILAKSEAIYSSVAKVVKRVADVFKEFAKKISDKVKPIGLEIIHNLLERIHYRFSQVGNALANFRKSLKDLGDALENSGFYKVLGSIWTMVKEIGKAIGQFLGTSFGAIFEGIKSADFETILDVMNALLTGGVLRLVMQAVEAFRKTFSGIGFIRGRILDTLSSLRYTMEAYQSRLKADVLMKIAGAIAVLTGSLLVLSLIDSKKLSQAIGSISVLFGELMGSMALYSKFMAGGGFKQSIGMTQFASVMTKMAVSILILSAALKNISSIDEEKLVGSLLSILTLMGGMVAVAKLLSTGEGRMLKGATSIVIFSAAIKVLASAVKVLSSLNINQIGVGLAGLAGILTSLMIFIQVTKNAKMSVGSTVGLLAVSGAIVILSKVVKDLGTIEVKELAKGLASIAALLATIAVFANVTGNAKHVISTGIALIAMATAMKILASVLKDLGSIRWEEIVKGLTTLAIALATIVIAVRSMPKNMPSLGIGLIAVSTALVILASAMRKMGGMQWDEIARGLVALGGSLGILSIALKSMTGTLSGSAALLVAVVSLNLLVPVLSILGAMKLSSIAKALLALAGTFTVLGVAGAVLGPLIPSILGLSGALALIGASVALAGVGLLAAGVGISAIAVGITALATSLAAGSTIIIAGITSILMSLIDLIPMVMIRIWDGITDILRSFTESIPVIGKAISTLIVTVVEVLVENIPVLVDGILVLITEVLEALAKHTPAIVDSLFAFIIGLIDGLAKNLPALIQAVVNLVVTFFAGIIDAIEDIDTDALVKTITGIGLMSALMLALAAIAALVPAAMIGVLGMGVVIAELSIVLAAVGLLAQIPGLSWLINEGGKLLGDIGTAIGSFIGGILGGIAGGLSNSLPTIGTNLSDFMLNLRPFIKESQKLDPSMLAGVKALTQVILLLTAANILDGLTSWLTGGTSLSDFGKGLSEFGPHFKKYADSVKGIDPKVVKVSADAAKSLGEMAKNLPNQGGVVGWFAGENSLSVFAEELAVFGPYLKEYADSVKGLDPKVVKASSDAALTLAEMADKLPNQGGMVSWFTGDNTLSVFAEELVEFGPYLKEYANSVKGLNPKVVKASSEAALALAEMADKLPNQGGMVSWFTGDNTLSVFGEELSEFGPYLKEYADSVDGLDPEVVRASAYAASVLSEMASILPNQGGVGSWFTGDNTLSVFGEELAKFGPYLKEYADSVDGLKPDVVISSARAAESLSKLASNLPDQSNDLVAWFKGENSLSKFAKELTEFGPSLKEYSDSVEGVNPGVVISSTRAAEVIAEFAGGLPDQSNEIAGWFKGENTLSKFAKELAIFGPELKAYSDSVDGIKPSVVTASTRSASAVVELASNLPEYSNKIVGWFTGENTLSKFAKELAIFGPSLKTYAESVDGINPSVVKASADAAATLSVLSTLPNQGGMISWFVGDNRLSVLGKELAIFGPLLKSYADSVEGLNPAVVKASADAASTLSALSTLPNQGGMVSWFVGDNRLSVLGKELAIFGPLLMEYSKSLEGLNPQIVKASVDATESLSAMAKLPDQGGMKTWFIGDNKLSVLGKELAIFGPLLMEYAQSVDGLNPQVVKASSDAVSSLSVMSTLPDQGGIKTWFFGDNRLSVLGTELAIFGPLLMKYAKSVEGLKPQIVRASSDAVTALADMADRLPDQGGVKTWFTGDNKMSDFGDELVAFGTAMSDYYNSIKNIATTKLGWVIKEANNLVDLANGMSKVESNAMSKFGDDLKNLGNKGIDGFISAFTYATANVTKTVSDMVNLVVDGISNKVPQVTISSNQLMSAFTTAITETKEKTGVAMNSILTLMITTIKGRNSEFSVVGKALMGSFVAGVQGFTGIVGAFAKPVTSALVSIRNQYNNYKQAGSYLVQGFAIGVSANTYRASYAAKVMAQAVKKSVERELDIRSPSRVLFGLGDNAGLGFVNALMLYAEKAYSAGSQVATAARTGISKTIASISEAIDNDIDTQPTIRPVLDLSNVRSGIGTINGIFGDNQRILATTSGHMVSSINSSMSSREKAERKNTTSGSDISESYTYNNQYEVQAIIREEADIKKVAEELHELQESSKRSKGKL